MPAKSLDFCPSSKQVTGREKRYRRLQSSQGAAACLHEEFTELIMQEYGPEADLWSVGMLLYQLLTGSVPLLGQLSRTSTLQQVRLCCAHAVPAAQALINLSPMMHGEAAAWRGILDGFQQCHCLPCRCWQAILSKNGMCTLDILEDKAVHVRAPAQQPAQGMVTPAPPVLTFPCLHS